MNSKDITLFPGWQVFFKEGEENSDVICSSQLERAEPGSADWLYCDLSIAMELTTGLANKWSAIEETYITMLEALLSIIYS